MAEPVSITHRAEERLLEGLTTELLEKGSVQADVTALTVPPATWRKVARAAARALQRPVETIADDRIVAAVLRDWPATPEERRRHDAMMHRVAEAMQLASSLVPDAGPDFIPRSRAHRSTVSGAAGVVLPLPVDMDGEAPLEGVEEWLSTEDPDDARSD